MVDEFEELQKLVETNRISPIIFNNIRHLMQHEEKLAEHFSQQIWDDASPLERLLLSAAAEEITRRQLDFIGLETLCSQVEAVAKDYSRKPMLDALEKLVAREILEEKELRYRFPVNLLRKWLAARFPLRKVRA